MKLKNLIFIISIIFGVACSSGNDNTPEQVDGDTTDGSTDSGNDSDNAAETWMTIPVPANAGDGMTWEFQSDISDDFEYEFAGQPNLAEFGNGKWTNFYHNQWDGPGATIWKHENVTVSGGNLRLITTREPGEMKTYTSGSDTYTDKATRLGCITSTKRVKYPVYVETRVKAANAFFASDIWMLSPDDTQEIDILEAYGAQNPRNGQQWFSERFHISHHVFIRNPFQDYQPKDVSTWQKIDGYPFVSSDWVRIGVYWKSPTHLEYYINGNLVKVMDNLDTVGGKDGIDPLGYTSPNQTADNTRTGLNKEMDIIINAEVQNWNAAADRFPTDEEIANSPEDHVLKIDWIRVFKPVSK
ncbi:LamG domain-containing protein [Tenacibaculum jejuense]|uniref:Beta-agarase, family GH16 n=1 Tax=Tenacibaculum jejuense TaxID=584609 RepID=A0A238UBZ1_9FLAO|nr:beta-agarase [Tenacibaculum jejuense]SNR16612.1 Beta-agarase, family GH16 precursor [Tenacibaculum jejuense]